MADAPDRPRVQRHATAPCRTASSTPVGQCASRSGTCSSASGPRVRASLAHGAAAILLAGAIVVVGAGYAHAQDLQAEKTIIANERVQLDAIAKGNVAAFAQYAAADGWSLDGTAGRMSVADFLKGFDEMTKGLKVTSWDMIDSKVQWVDATTAVHSYRVYDPGHLPGTAHAKPRLGVNRVDEEERQVDGDVPPGVRGHASAEAVVCGSGRASHRVSGRAAAMRPLLCTPLVSRGVDRAVARGVVESRAPGVVAGWRSVSRSREFSVSDGWPRGPQACADPVSCLHASTAAWADIIASATLHATAQLGTAVAGLRIRIGSRDFAQGFRPSQLRCPRLRRLKVLRAARSLCVHERCLSVWLSLLQDSSGGPLAHRPLPTRIGARSSRRCPARGPTRSTT